jgi:Spy/CpxP family protein refolding chaperone
MKRWFLMGVAAVLAGGAVVWAQAPAAGEPQDEVTVEEMWPGPVEGLWMTAPAEDVLMELAEAGPVGDVWMAEGTFEAPLPEGLDFVAEAGGPGGGMGMGPGGPGMMGPGGPPPMMRHRMMRFRGRPMGMMGRGMGGPMMLARVARAIGLTDEQRDRMRGLRTAHQKEMIRMGADARIAKMELAEALRQPNPRPEDVKAKVAAVNAARGQMLEKTVNFRLEMKKVLTPEQREKIKDLMMNRMMGGGGRGGWGWGGGQQWKPKEDEPKK